MILKVFILKIYPRGKHEDLLLVNKQISNGMILM